MNTNPRDTHFANFAQALARELTEAHVFYDATGLGQFILVRRAYDLAKHVIQSIDYQDRFGIDYAIKDIPDLPALPEVQE